MTNMENAQAARAAFQAGLGAEGHVGKTTLRWINQPQKMVQITLSIQIPPHEPIDLPFIFRLSGDWEQELRIRAGQHLRRVKSMNGAA